MPGTIESAPLSGAPVSARSEALEPLLSKADAARLLGASTAASGPLRPKHRIDWRSAPVPCRASSRTYAFTPYDGTCIRSHHHAVRSDRGQVLRVMGLHDPQNSLRRGFQFAERFGMTIDPDSLALLCTLTAGVIRGLEAFAAVADKTYQQRAAERTSRYMPRIASDPRPRQRVAA
jgi:hypothetical protein